MTADEKREQAWLHFLVDYLCKRLGEKEAELESMHARIRFEREEKK